ncbi:quinone oxidoreductase family protein [Labedaea rhizosphaerae]|uniref:NADPH2:quinone reductase n=1 Tax=Labedaea rhizosphaerae TaxID=598644 RepID=A0A4R6RZ12_LABRH|nr:zinc-binding dehydrogenase [Labedaea rhizosphaerae]TDP92144.1 NADPH2:quinone reductase [Labedaea rhizosphaerae]
MRAVVLRETGGPEVLVPAEVPVPSPGPGQVLLRVEAAAVSAGETRMRSGAIPMPFPLPVVFGAEAVGVVEAVGPGVEPAVRDRRFVGVTGGRGSYAEFAVANLAMLAAVPDGLEPTDVVAMAAPGAMAFGLARKAGLGTGETALIEGGSGKIGNYLVPLAGRSARVVATAGTAPGRDRVRALGAEVVLDHSTPDWPDRLPGKVDVVFEMVGGAVADRLLDVLTPGTGRMLVYGSLSGAPTALDAAKLRERGLRVIGCGGPGWAADIFGVDLPGFLAAAARGEVARPVIEAVLPLADAAEAHRRLEAGRLVGRVVLVP